MGCHQASGLGCTERPEVISRHPLFASRCLETKMLMVSTGVKVGAAQAISPATWWPRWLWTLQQGDNSCSSEVSCPQMSSPRAQVRPAAVPHPLPPMLSFNPAPSLRDSFVCDGSRCLLCPAFGEAVGAQHTFPHPHLSAAVPRVLQRHNLGPESQFLSYCTHEAQGLR